MLNDTFNRNVPVYYTSLQNNYSFVNYDTNIYTSMYIRKYGCGKNCLQALLKNKWKRHFEEVDLLKINTKLYVASWCAANNTDVIIILYNLYIKVSFYKSLDVIAVWILNCPKNVTTV